jgi:integrase
LLTFVWAYALGVPENESVIVVPLQSNASALLAGAPVAALRRRLKFASLFLDRLLLETGIFRVHAGPSGELIGLAWSDVDLATGRLHVRGDQSHDVNSEDSDREIIFDEQTAAVLRAWRMVQRAERLAWGPA